MINYKLDKNKWTVIIDDFDMTTVTQEGINQMSKLIAKNTLVVIRNQNLTVKDEVRILKMFKDTQKFVVAESDDYVSTLAGAMVEGSEDLFLRVSGKKDEQGRVGIAAYDCEMVWHCNEPGVKDRKPIVWLHSVEGSKGSRTSYTNNSLSYNDLPEDLKQEIENCHLEIYQGLGLGKDDLESDYEELSKMGEDGFAEYNPPLIKINKAGNKGIYFPMYHVHKIKELNEKRSKEITDFLREFVVREEYVYHHDWEDGDILIADQEIGIHKRWPFKKITERTLHRACFDYPDQDYLS
jgi:alpha-ketoglutarate-dependent taurine dioxygenase